MDDFARRLLGAPDAVAVPPPGTWLEPGERAFTVRVGGREADLVSPVAGEVVAGNAALEGRPGLAGDDPYGRGWVLAVRPSRLEPSLRGLLSGRLARRWMEEAREALDLRLMALSGSVLQDGGEPQPGFSRHLSPDDWRGVVRDFLLT
jgi:glycine cleavage system H protein